MPFPNTLAQPSHRNNSSRLPLVIILGPTAVGKTEISIRLAEQFTGEIVSADSRLFYRGMDIGTAKPTLDERRGIPHHLVDVADPDDVWSLALFQRAANKAIRSIVDQHHLPFLVGGTGQFIRALVEGWRLPLAQPNPRLRDFLSQWSNELGPQELHRRLALLDLQAAGTIDPSNVRRTIRALEVILTTGVPFSEQKRAGDLLYNPLLLGLTSPRPDLYRRIDERIEKMIRDGFVTEVQWLLAQGYSPELPTMSAIGYREIVAHLQGHISLDEAITLMKRRTRVFVRRQANWFKLDDPQIHWFQARPSALPEMGETIEHWLNTIGWKNGPSSSSIN